MYICIYTNNFSPETTLNLNNMDFLATKFISDDRTTDDPADSLEYHQKIKDISYNNAERYFNL